jgi:hypothetical protein
VWLSGAALIHAEDVSAPRAVVTGQVVDEAGNPIVGATVSAGNCS